MAFVTCGLPSWKHVTVTTSHNNNSRPDDRVPGSSLWCSVHHWGDLLHPCTCLGLCCHRWHFRVKREEWKGVWGYRKLQVARCFLLKTRMEKENSVLKVQMTEGEMMMMSEPNNPKGRGLNLWGCSVIVDYDLKTWLQTWPQKNVLLVLSRNDLI